MNQSPLLEKTLKTLEKNLSYTITKFGCEMCEVRQTYMALPILFRFRADVDYV